MVDSIHSLRTATYSYSPTIVQSVVVTCERFVSRPVVKYAELLLILADKLPSGRFGHNLTTDHYLATGHYLITGHSWQLVTPGNWSRISCIELDHG